MTPIEGLTAPGADRDALQRLHDLVLLEQVARDVTSSLDLDRVLALILDRARAALGAEAASALLIDPQTHDLVFHAVSSPGADRLLGQHIPPGVGIAGWVAQTGQPARVADVANDSHFYSGIDRLDGFRTRSILAVPLRVQDRLLGVLEVLNHSRGAFSAEDERLLGLVASGAAVAIDNARLYTEMGRRTRELTVRNEISEWLSAANSLADILEAVTARLAEVARGTACQVILEDTLRSTFEPTTCFYQGHARAIDPAHVDGLVAFLRRLGVRDHPVHIPDLVAAGHLGLDEAARCPARSLLVLPLAVDAALLGWVLIGHASPTHFNDDDLSRSWPLVQQIALAVRKVQATEHLSELVEARTAALQQERTRLAMIHEVSQVTVSSLDPITLLKDAACQIRAAFGYRRVYLWMQTGAQLTLAANAGGEPGDVFRSIAVTPDSVPGWVAATGKRLYLPDVVTPAPGFGQATQTRLGLPLIARQDLVGVLEVYGEPGSRFDDDDVSALESIAARLAMALKNARLFEEVATSQRDWATTFNSIAEGVVLHDNQWVILRANQALAQLIGTAPESLVGRDLADVFGLSASDVEALRSGSGAPVSLDLVRHPGERTWALTGYALPHPDGQLNGRVLVVRDVTEERAWRARMFQTEKLASLGQLSAGIAHEINNPLGFIHSNLNTLSRYISEVRTVFAHIQTAYGGDPQWAGCVDGHDMDFLLQDLDLAVTESQEGVERVQGIVVGLKNFARADQNPELKDVDLQTAIEGALKIAWNEIKYKATVEKDYGALPPVHCNPHRISQVLINLLVNAAQAIDRDGRITIRTRCVEEWVEISIQDTGHGVSAEHLPRLFDPFFTTKEIGKGTGLGLSVAYGIVKEHGGWIDVASRPGQGTTFTIELPVAGPPASAPVDKDGQHDH